MTTNINSKIWVTYTFLFLAQIMVSTNIVGTKYLIASLPFLFLLAIRFLLATVLLLPLHWLVDKDKNTLSYHFSKLTKRDWIIISLQALLAGVCFNFLMVWGLGYTDANVAGIIASTLPAIIVILSWLVLKDQFTSKKALCVTLATIGLLAVSLNNFNGPELSHSFIGDILVLLALLPEALYYVLTKLKYQRLPVFLLSSVMCGMNALVLVPLMFIFVDFNSFSVTPLQCVVLLVIGLSAGLFYICWFIGSANVDATMGALSTAVMPLITVVIAWLTLGETVTTIQLLGMLFVITSIVVYARK